MESKLKRIIALIIDSVFVTFFSNILIDNVTINGFNYSYDPLSMKYAFTVLSFFIYFLVFDLLNNGQTIGKSLFELYDKQLTLKNRILRTIFKMISIVLTPITIFLFLFKKIILHELFMNNRLQAN